MKKKFLLIIAVLSLGSLNAQVIIDYLKAADDYFKKGDYYSAAEYYEKYLGMGKGKTVAAGYTPYANQAGKSKKENAVLSTKQQAMYNLAESYRLLHYHVKAEPVYAKTLEFDKAKFPLARYWYAMTLRTLNKYPEATAAFTQFVSEYGNSDTYKESAYREIANLSFIQTQLNKKDLDLYKVSKTGGEVPDTGAVYAPVWFNNAVYFTSTKADNTVPKLQVHNNRVYQAVYNDGAINSVSKVALPETKDIQQGVISITPDGNSIFLTRWTVGHGSKSSSIYKSYKTTDNWTEPVPLGETVNVPGFNSKQAFVMPGGKHLLFSSDQPGGSGGFDLWSVEIDANGNAGKPTNLGTLINTSGDEEAPFYHDPSKKLVFSSNGRVGMGGMDFYYSYGTIGNWSDPVNFGYPVNSPKEDVYFTSRGNAGNILEDVLFSSDRNDVCCLELFSLKKANLSKQVRGIVVACDKKTPLEGVTVSIQDTIGNTFITKVTTDANGNYSFNVDDFQPLKAVAAASGYYTSSIDFNEPLSDTAFTLVNPDICLNAIKVEEPVVVQNVLYDFDKAELKPEYHPEVDKLVAMFNANPGIVVELSSHTDNKGSDEYNQKLSLARAQSVVDYLVKKGVKASQLKVQGYGSSQPVAPNQNDDGSDNPEGRQKNRRTEFKVLKN